MKLYFAPLEGITTYTFRNTHAEVFGHCDAYYAPFITPTDNEKLSLKTIRDITPERNAGVNLKVQVLTNSASAFFKFTDKIRPLGYNEVNLNLGCPSNTVCKKGRGAAFLREPDALERFFEEVFATTDFKISVKTRIGFSAPDEFERLIEIYNRFAIELLIIHPRTRAQMYKAMPDMDAFATAVSKCKMPLCYNGNINTKEQFGSVCSRFENLDSVMLGRGAVANPAIFREIKGGKPLSTNELLCFTDRLIEKYNPLLGSDIYTLHKLKEIWLYCIENYPCEKKTAKLIKKAAKLGEFRKSLDLLPKECQR
ncbi:MAG: tRNA-dihydrouridine synthase family protein [Clostridia bacterium]|nr:tRNA-dihydrouridine synthase family protein [Clostridia bacterium]